MLNERESIIRDFITKSIPTYTLNTRNAAEAKIGSLEAILEDGHHYHYLDDGDGDFTECLEIIEFDLMKWLGDLYQESIKINSSFP